MTTAQGAAPASSRPTCALANAGARRGGGGLHARSVSVRCAARRAASAEPTARADVTLAGRVQRVLTRPASRRPPVQRTSRRPASRPCVGRTARATSLAAGAPARRDGLARTASTASARQTATVTACAARARLGAASASRFIWAPPAPSVWPARAAAASTAYATMTAAAHAMTVGRGRTASTYRAPRGSEDRPRASGVAGASRVGASATC